MLHVKKLLQPNKLLQISIAFKDLRLLVSYVFEI